MSQLILDATVGGPTANTFRALADAEVYFQARPFSDAWYAATQAAKNVGLVWGTRVLSRQKWMGTKGTDPTAALTQALPWPRRWSPTLEFDAYPEFVTDNFIDTSVAFNSELTIPACIGDATCELALITIAAGGVDPFQQDTKFVKRKKVDVIETEYFASQEWVRGLGRFPVVLQLIQHLLRGSAVAEIDRV